MTYQTPPEWEYFVWRNLQAKIHETQDRAALFVLKELIDNYLDAADEQKVDPEIDARVTFETDNVVVKVSSNTFVREDHILSVYKAGFGTKVSSKTFVKVPARGLFGMASKVIQALPYSIAIDLGKALPEELPIELTTWYPNHFFKYRIGAVVDPRERTAKPKCVLSNEPSPETKTRTGTIIVVPLPFSGNKDILSWEATTLLKHFGYLNPNLTLHGDSVNIARHKRSSSRLYKGRPSVLSYTFGEFQESLFVQKQRFPDMTIQQFLKGMHAGWKGFAGFQSVSQNALLLRTGLSFEENLKDLSGSVVRQLFTYMCSSTKSKGELGRKGAVVLRRALLNMIPGNGKTVLSKEFGERSDPGRPWVLEAAAAELRTPGISEIVIGVNRSPLRNNPFANTNLDCGKKFSSTSALLEELKTPVRCVISLTGLIEPLSQDKAELDTRKYFGAYEKALCTVLKKFRKHGKVGPKTHEMIDWLKSEMERRKQLFEKKKNIPDAEWTSQQSLWYKARNAYFQKHPQATMDDMPDRKYFISRVRGICKEIGVTRESCGIFAAERAMIYFRGMKTGVSLDSIQEVFKFGSDLISIEKEGMAATFEQFASKIGVAIMNSRGQLVDYAEELLKMAKESGAKVWIVTDMDDAGFVMRNNLPGVACLGVDMKMLQEISKDSKTPFEDFLRQVREPLKMKYKITDEQRKELELLGGGDGSQNSRAEIDAVVAVAGAGKVWDYFVKEMQRLEPVRDLTRSLKQPEDLVKLPAELSASLDNLVDAFKDPILRFAKEIYSSRGYKEWSGGFLLMDGLEEMISGYLTEAVQDKITNKMIERIEAATRLVKEGFSGLTLETAALPSELDFKYNESGSTAAAEVSKPQTANTATVQLQPVPAGDEASGERNAEAKNHYFREDQLTKNERKLDSMKKILRYLHKQGYPGSEKLAEVLGVSTKTVDRYLEEMEARGLVRKTDGSTFSLSELASKAVEESEKRKKH